MVDYHPAVELAVQLVRISSENPNRLETEVVTFIGDWLAKQGVEFRFQDVESGRRNVIARVPGRGLRAPIALIAHCDTVPAGQGWSKEPFGGTVEGRRLYGRGASDMKGGLAAALYAAVEAHRAGPPPGDLLVAVTVDEEGANMLGAQALVDAGIVGRDTLIITPEPTSLQIIRSHRGVMWYEIIVHGVMSHGGHAERGVDANHALAEAICELKAVVNAVPFVDPLVGGALLSVGKMEGGGKTNVVPNLAMAEIDFRVPPPFTVETSRKLVERAVERGIARVKGASAEVNDLGLPRPPVETPEDAPVLALLQAACQTVMGRVPPVGGYVAYTDAALVSLAAGNRNAVLFGPGNLENAHAVDEWASIDDIATCAEVFKTLAMAE